MQLSRQREAVFTLEKEVEELRKAAADSDGEEGAGSGSSGARGFKGFGKPGASGGSAEKQLAAMKQAVRTAQVLGCRLRSISACWGTIARLRKAHTDTSGF